MREGKYSVGVQVSLLLNSLLAGAVEYSFRNDAVG